MDTAHIEYFMVIAKTMNITKAAERLYVSQSHLSRIVRNMEYELGTELIDRSYGNRGVRLTPAGERFLLDCEVYIKYKKKLMEDLSVFSNNYLQVDCKMKLNN